MRSGWKLKPLAAILSIRNGYAFDAKAFSAEAGMPLIRIRDLKNGTTTQTNFDGPFDQRYVVQAGSFLIGMDGEFGCFEWHGPDALLNQRVCKLHSFVEDIDPRFLFYGINKHLKEIEDNTAFTTVKHLSSKQIADIEFAFPPLDQQRRIVAVLDKAFAGIATVTANALKNLGNARALFESAIEGILANVANCQNISLLNAADPSCSLSYGIVQPGEEFDGGLPIVRPTDLRQKFITRQNLKCIDPTLAASYKRTIIRGDDLLLCVRGTTGTLSIATQELAGGNVTRGIVPIRFNPDLLSQELGYFLLRSAYVQAQIKAATYGTALMQINIGDLKNLELRVPRVEDQNELSARLNSAQDSIESLVEIQESKLAALSELKQSLLQKAFAGELT